MVVIQAGRPVLVAVEELGAQPVEHRHEVVDDHLDPMSCEILQGLAVIGDVGVTRRLAELDVLMDVHRLDDLALQAGLIDLLDVGGNLLL